MALATVQDCKDLLRIQHSAEDAMLTAWLTQAIAAIEGYVRLPITAELRSWVLERPRQIYLLVRKLFVPMYPIAPEDSSAGRPALVLTDADAVDLVEGTDYRLDLRTGELAALTNGDPNGVFDNFPYTVTAYVGLSARPDYATRIEPALNAAILDVISDRYQRRNPNATSESTGGGVSTSYSVEYGLTPRACSLLDPYRLAVAR